ncbi:MAG: hypothetical protein R2787_08540 [Saprospiraceae bacterium]
MADHELHLSQGLECLSRMSISQWNDVCQGLKGLKPGDSFDEVEEALPDFLDENERFSLVVLVLYLSSPLQIESEENLMAELMDLVNHSNVLTKKEIDIADERLHILFPLLTPVRITQRGIELREETSWSYQSSRIVSDIRLIFNNHLEDKLRHGLIIHQLRITVKQGKKSRDLYMAFSRQDLQQLKDQIDRALKKDSLIQADYSSKIDFFI